MFSIAVPLATYLARLESLAGAKVVELCPVQRNSWFKIKEARKCFCLGEAEDFNKFLTYNCCTYCDFIPDFIAWHEELVSP